jgi:hypothetical protein
MDHHPTNHSFLFFFFFYFLGGSIQKPTQPNATHQKTNINIQHSAGAVSQHRQLRARCETNLANRGQCNSHSAEFGSVDISGAAGAQRLDGYTHPSR